MSKPSIQAGSSLKGPSGVAALSATIKTGKFLRECGPAASISSKGLRRASLQQIVAAHRHEEGSELSEEAFNLLNEQKQDLYSGHFGILERCIRGVEDGVFRRILETAEAFAASEHLEGKAPSALTLLKQWSQVTEFLSEAQQQRLFQTLMECFPEASLDDVHQGMDESDQLGRLLFSVLTSVHSRNAVIQHQNLFFELLGREPSILVDNWSILTKSMKNESFARMVIEGMVRVRVDFTDYFNDWMFVLHRIHEVNYGSRLHPFFVRCLQEDESDVRDVLLFTSDPRALTRGGFRSQRSAECSICGCTE
jgi:hypothetical protein